MPSADQEVFDLLATRYLSGEASGQEYARLFEYLKTKKWNARFTRMQRNWDAATARPVVGLDLKAAAKQLAAEIAKERTSPKSRPVAKVRASSLGRPIKRSSKQKNPAVISPDHATAARS